MTVVLRVGAVSARSTRRRLAATAAAAAVIVALAVASLAAGDYPIAPVRILATLLGAGEGSENLVVLQLRLPRVLLGGAVGALLGVSGALAQGAARNDLASPDLLGVTGGASAGAVAVIVFGGATGFSSVLHGVGATAAALAGGMAAAAVVGLILRTVRGGAFSLLLVGVGVSALFSGVTSWMIVEASIEDAERASAWLMGSLGGRGLEEALLAVIALTVVALVLVPLGARLDALQLGADTARAVGHDVARTSTILLLCAVVAASVSAAVAGPVGFVALVAPHLARLAARAPRPPLGLSALTGAVVVLASDLVARTAFAPLVLPTGAVTAVVGAPFLIWLLVTAGKGHRP